MRALWVAFANKYTGAAAVAEHCCRALHRAGAEASLLFVAGRNLERRLGRSAWAHAELVKERTPLRILRNLNRLRRRAEDSDVVICQLPHDHLLCVAAGIHRRVPLVRNFRNRRHLGSDPWHRWLTRRISGAVLAHSGLAEDLRTMAGPIPHLVLPVPLDDRFRPDVSPGGWRERLAIPADAPVLGMVGKLAPGRGFDLLLETAARVEPELHVVAVGHGEEQPALERLADELGTADCVHWTGYQEHGLPELYAAMDVVLFAAPGSDHGHRSISEAQACARPVVAAAVEGVEDLIADGRTGRIVEPTAEALAAAVSDLLRNRGSAHAVAVEASRAVADRRMESAGHRLAGFFERLLAERAP